MLNDTNLSKNEKVPSTENGTRETLWEGLFNSRVNVLLLIIGLLFILYNIVIIFGVNTRPNTWLFYLDMRYWSVSTAIILWIVTIWVASESTDITENYLPFIRSAVLIYITFAIIFALLSYFDTTSYFIGFVIAAIIVACAVRSLSLLYIYRYGKDESIDLEEAKWFWGLSGLIFATLVMFGVMSIIPVKIQIHASSSEYGSMSLFTYCSEGLIDLIWKGQGPLGLRIFGIILVTAVIAFVYVAGKWMSIILLKIFSKIKEN